MVKSQAHLNSWTGLGHWNLYFILKLALYWAGYIKFDLLYNLAFAAALIVPVRWCALNIVRHLIAIPIGIALFYHDSWLPPFGRLLAQPEVLNFSYDYLLELLGRFINWQVVAAGFVLLVAYLYLAQWLRLTSFTILIFVGMGLHTWTNTAGWFAPTSHTTSMAGAPDPALAHAGPLDAPPATRDAPALRSGKPDNTTLNRALQSFYTSEAARRVELPSSAPQEAFDILFISICSLSWSDLEEVGLRDHPLFSEMNVIFDRFNAATSYSGPAVLRLLRANCGQSPHAALYEPAEASCHLFQNLQRLGFDTELSMNHNGQFQGFLDELRNEGQLPVPYLPSQLRPALTGFDGSPIWDDLQTMTTWWLHRQQSTADRKALLYNTITLHDGNREATADGGGRTAPFVTRASKLLDQLHSFIKTLEQSKKKVLIVLVPEHGAALKSDKMQIAGMREVPTSDITHVPVAMRLINGADPTPPAPLHISSPSSYLALSELLSRMLKDDVFAQSRVDWSGLTADLPASEWVSENEGTVLMSYGERDYIRIGGGSWVEYPR